MILDAGFLVSIDRGARDAKGFLVASLRQNTPLSTTHPVVAQVWRDGSRQARLSKLLGAVEIYPLDEGAAVGAILARSGTSDVVDAHLIAVAVQRSEPILTGDVEDLEILASSLPGDQPRIHAWPDGA